MENMMGFWWLIILVCLVYLAISLFLAYEFAYIAKEKGYHNKKYFWCVFLFGIIGMIMVCALPDKYARNGGNNTNYSTKNRTEHIIDCGV